MKESKERLDFLGIAPEKVQFGCLLLLGTIDLFLMIAAPLHPWLFEYLVESYLVVPALIFLGAALSSDLTRSAKHDLLLGIVTVLWMALAQAAQRKALEGPANINTWWAAYLLAFPFAAVTKDGRSRRGLKMFGALAVAGSMILTGCSLMLSLNILPNFLSNAVIWDSELRLVAMNHPNISGWTFLTGIIFCLGFYFTSKEKWHQGLILGATILQLWMLSLTNSRTTIIMAAVAVAGAVFFCIAKGGWKRFVLGLLAALLTVGALFTISNKLYHLNRNNLIAGLTAQDVATEEPTEANEDENLATAPVTAEASSASSITETASGAKSKKLPQGIRTRNSFWQDLKTFTGRTGIWKAGLNSLRIHPAYLIRGTSMVGAAVKEGGNPFGVLHSHNAWMEMLIGFGIPGLVLALYFTFLAVRGICCILFTRQSSMLQKCVALLVLCMLGAGVLEPFLFTAYLYCHFYCVVFMLCVGYLNLWREEIKHPERV